MKTDIPRVLPPRTIWKPQPHWLVTNWPGLMEPTRDESCPSGQCRVPTAPRDGEFPSPGQKSFLHLYNFNNPRTKTEISRVYTAPHGVETPTQGTLLSLLIGVREASGPLPMGASTSARKIIKRNRILLVTVVQLPAVSHGIAGRCTFNMDQHVRPSLDPA